MLVRALALAPRSGKLHLEFARVQNRLEKIYELAGDGAASRRRARLLTQERVAGMGVHCTLCEQMGISMGFVVL
jgi:hypothetical protein